MPMESIIVKQFYNIISLVVKNFLLECLVMGMCQVQINTGSSDEPEANVAEYTSSLSSISITYRRRGKEVTHTAKKPY